MFFAVLAAIQLGAASATNEVIISEIIEEPAWKRQVVMQDGDGEIINDSGAVGSAAETAAIDNVATNAHQIADAARVVLTNALERLHGAQSHAATNAIGLAFAFAPESQRTNLTGYVVKTESSGSIDTQWVWYNRELALKPSRFVAYEMQGRAETNKVTWVDWDSPQTVTIDGRTWQGCRVCTVTRPVWARGLPCLDRPNDILGGPSGFDFGDMLVTVGGVPAYTGIITNATTGATLYFDNGFLKGEL